MFSGLPTFAVDFHEAEDSTPIAIAVGAPIAGRRWGYGFSVGDPVQLWDEESGYCLGRVQRVRRGRVMVLPIWETWSPAPVVELDPLRSFEMTFELSAPSTPVPHAGVSFAA